MKTKTKMKEFHITYFLEDRNEKTLTGVTVTAENIMEALNIFHALELVHLTKIKYIIEL